MQGNSPIFSLFDDRMSAKLHSAKTTFEMVWRCDLQVARI